MSGRPLHVLWLIDHVCYDGSLHGGGRLFRHLVPEFDRGRVQIFPYFLRASEEVRRVFADAPVQVPTLHKGKYDPFTLLTVWRLCRKHRVDVMHLFCYASSAFGRTVGALVGVPTVIHDFDTGVYFGYPRYLRIVDRALAGFTGRAIAASPLTRRYMTEVRSVPADRIEIFPHAIPQSRFRREDPADRHRRRAALGWDERHTVFCVPTKLGPDRGNECVLRAFARLLRNRPDARLVIVYKPTYYHRVPEEYGDIGWLHDTARMRTELDALVATLELTDRVVLVESLDDPGPSFATSDVVVIPFLHERFSSVNLLEAFAVGLPAIATDIGEQRELVQDGGNGLLVSPGDEAALAQAMLRLVDDPAMRARMGSAAEATARTYGVPAVVDRLSGLYERLAAESRRGLRAAQRP